MLAVWREYGFDAILAKAHYDSEKDRRPSYQRLVRQRKIKPGVAADDGVGLHYAGGKLERAVTALPKARAYRLPK